VKTIDFLTSEETLFRDEAVFTPSYVPEDFMHRDSELQEIALALKPGIRGSNPVNTLIYGPPGTGKTTAVKHVFEKLGETTKKLIPVYINCEDFSTPYAVFARIYTIVMGIAPPSTGKPLEDVKERIFSKLSKDNKSIVIALDEIDRLLYEHNLDRVLIDLLKAHSTYGYDKIGVIGITVEDDFLAKLDEKTRSVYNPARLQFKKYNKKDIKDILGMRVKMGLYDGVLKDNLLDDIVEKVMAKGGDLRTGIDLIRRSALFAEKDSLKSIKKEHIEKAYAALPQRERKEKEDELSEDNRLLLKIISENAGKTSGHIFNLFRDSTGAGVKRYNEAIAKLEKMKLIKTEYKEGIRGRSREIRLA
jgi:cell division control protein 6